MAFNYKDNEDIVNAKNRLEQHTANRVADWTGGQYGQAVKDTMNKIQNREKFSYDMNADALYQQYKDKYMAQGKLAMADTIGQASALTGGYGNSYATTAGFQAYQGYLQNLNDVVPQLYQLAMDKYKMEGDELNSQLNMYNNAYNQEYGQYRDKVGDWYNEANRLQSAYDSEYNRGFANYQQQVSEQQHAASLAAQRAAAAASQKQGVVARQTKNTDRIEASILSNDEFNRYQAEDPYMISGSKKYNSYEKYAESTIEEMANKYDLTDGELYYLMKKYGLA